MCTVCRYKILNKIVNAEYDKYFRGEHAAKYDSMLISYLKNTPLMPAETAGTIVTTSVDNADDDEEEDNLIPGIVPVGNMFFNIFHITIF